MAADKLDGISSRSNPCFFFSLESIVGIGKQMTLSW